MTLAGRILVARAQATSRKAARKRRAELERELAGYASPAERCDLEAALTGIRPASRLSSAPSSPVNPGRRTRRASRPSGATKVQNAVTAAA
jgi:hypothetical protein